MTKSIESLKWRYATKNFDPKADLAEDELHLLKEAFNLTATSYGLQPCRMVVLKNKVLQEKMMPMAFGQRQVLDAPAVLVLCTISVDDAYVQKYFSLVEQVRSTPREILEPFQKQLEEKFIAMPHQEVEAWARNQAYISLGNLMTVCAQERIDSCPMEGFLPKKVDELLGLAEKGLKSVLLLPVGHRKEDDQFASMEKVRLPLEDSVISMN
ncbi:NAD(P)H-dependent oxidoreductase [Nonlabens marinus]|uniref:Oxygen-insensitive NAD(P)H nitroreductase n=1 Tax=Nonlabens marinus S1-08 TaxID=1454201 RepID=W8VZ75_9FLAO|nr:NAD(P)H-dependent oxidoreductase [Nonlabens marinus]BAO54086.1 oxygen-insensitive NAD(P)H nitroreductase [Nonlabens marinus S1-08]